ncbi:hypothetical protein [Vulgatibacter incomptus]|nr:hypothetical protein [Vulgatibacter incomptus]
MNKMWRSSTLLAAAALALAGCGQERDPLNRVQPDVLEKSFFVGSNPEDPSDAPEFYSQATIVDVGFGAAQDGLFTSTYAQPLARLKWTIQQDYLIGRLTYERIDGSDGKGTGAGPLRNEGVIAAMFKIEKHFDIQRSYNPTTGEEQNIVEENTDRPWYERKYMRVNWSKNENTDSYDFDTLSMLGIIGGIKYESSSYFVNDPSDENAPKFVPEQGYFDVTTKAFAVPQQVDLRRLGWGIDSYPACFLSPEFAGGAGPSANCNPVEITIRHSFKRLENKDYEPADWDGYRFQNFGAFTTERLGYARNYGMTDDRQYRFINRYNIWERSHYYANPQEMTGAIECFTPNTTKPGEDPNRGYAINGTADECKAAGPGSKCDTFSQKCTLPYRERDIRPQPWYLASGSAPEYFDGTNMAAQEWDTALRASVMTARYAECMATRKPGSTEPECDATYPIYRGQQNENDDAIALSREVDFCFAGKAYPQFAGNCEKVADQVGKERSYSAGVIEVAKLPRIIVLCHSPVEAGDPAQCGGPRLPATLTAEQCYDARNAGDKATVAVCDAARTVRRGDLRYHQVNVITAPQTPSPWGIMVDSHDPLTGEKVAASINIWSHVTDLASQGLVDLARYAAGELTTEDVTEGTYVYDWSRAAESAGKAGSLSPMTRDQLDQRVADITGVSADTYRNITVEAYGSRRGRIEEVASKLAGVRADLNAPSDFKHVYDARRKAAVANGLDALLTTKAMQQYAGVTTNTPDYQVLASPLQGSNPSLMRDMRNAREVALAARGTCMMSGEAGEAPAPVSIANLGKELQRKFGNFNPADNAATQLARAERMRKYIAHRYNYAVIAHEMGHSIGLRHNFVSTSDAWGYRPQYWQLRTSNGKRVAECKTLRADDDFSCVGPRYFDPASPEQSEQLIQMFMHSSVMDYPGELSQDMVGLGAYDFAAARSFYGDVVAVFQDPSYLAGKARGTGMLAKDSNFGGILGIQPMVGMETNVARTQTFHYSQLQNNYDLISDCKEITASQFKPAVWNEKRDGNWDPLFDGMLVTVDGKHTRCQTQKVDYVPYASLRFPTSREIDANRFRGGPAVDRSSRVRVPYGFATDRWADLGNVSVYRHVNGADIYELFDFLITQQEMNHIFDNYRRNRLTFSIRGAANRTLSRYNEKLRDAAKGLGLMVNIYKDYAAQEGLDFGTLWAAVVKTNSWDTNLMASGLAFDHFTRLTARPEIGPHGIRKFKGAEDPVLRSGAGVEVVIPNGASGAFGDKVTYGGKLVENTLSDNHGEYDSEYTLNAGSYYEKAFTAMLMTESVDNFISSSLDDFVDARYRSVSLADVFPDGFRRWLGNNLTGDDNLKGPRLATLANGTVDRDTKTRLPTKGIGWTSWWPSTGPETCFAEEKSIRCSTTPTTTSRAIDPQIGWEQQKFLIAFTLMYLPENAKQTWLNQMALWEKGLDSDPGFQNRIEFHDPHGKVWVAKTYGRETIFGKSVQKGIGARVLEWANELTSKAYVTDPGPDLDGDGQPDWYVPVLGADGQPIVKFDPTMEWIKPDGTSGGSAPAGCNATDNSKCTCSMNRSCVMLDNYVQVPYFLRQAIVSYGFTGLGMKGWY